MKEKALIFSVCLLGLVAVFLGMTRKDNVVFIVGILLLIVGYIMIRRKLKASLKEKIGSGPNSDT